MQTLLLSLLILSTSNSSQIQRTNLETPEKKVLTRSMISKPLENSVAIIPYTVEVTGCRTDLVTYEQASEKSDFVAFFSNLFDSKSWPPRWICGSWTSFHGWLYIGSDLLIWLAYMIIPVILIFFIQKKPEIPFLPVFYLFGAFILLCGATHAIDALMFWWPGYRVSALVRLLTAIVSMGTVFALIRDLPKALNLAPKDGSSGLAALSHFEPTGDVDKQIARLKAEISRLEKEKEEIK